MLYAFLWKSPRGDSPPIPAIMEKKKKRSFSMMEDFLCTCALAIRVLDFSVCSKCQQKDFTPPKQNVGRGGLLKYI